MTPEQKIQYWTAQIMDVTRAPQMDSSNDGVLDDMFLAMDARTALDKDTGAVLIHFMGEGDTVFDSAQIVLQDDEGMVLFSDEQQWHVRFSEKNGVLYMTIRDGKDKTVYYQQK